MDPATKRVLVTGARGLLGTPLTAALSRDPNNSVLACDRSEVDITDTSAVSRVLADFRPDVVVNCAAFTRVDDCEAEEDAARRVNADGAGILAAAAAGAGARLIHISTDYVFDGAAAAPYLETVSTARPEQLSAYGRTKLLGEQAVLSADPRALLVRTSWLYGANGPSFPATILRLAKEKPHLRVVDDQRGSPTNASDVADALVRLIDTEANGIVHVTNSGNCTWFDFAKEILRLKGISTPVEPITAAEFPRPAKRPTYSVLDNRRLIQWIGRPLRPWQEAISDFLLSYAGAS